MGPNNPLFASDDHVVAWGITALAGRFGLPEDTLKGLAILIAGYIFGILFLLIPSHPRFIPVKHVYSIVASCMLFFSFFDLAGFIELMGMALVVYFASWVGRSDRRVPVALFLFCLGGLSLKFISTLNSTSKFNHTTVIMVLVIKLTNFAWSAHDGTQSKKDIWPELAHTSIDKFPSIIEYMGYVFFFPGFVVGPAVEFREYINFIHGKAPFDKIPNRSVPVLKAVGSAMITMTIYTAFTNTFNYEFCTTDVFLIDYPLWKRYAYIQLAVIVTRCRYYSAWKLSAGVHNLIGFGYSGTDPVSSVSRWDRGENVRILNTEFSFTPKQFADNWNIKTAAWLRTCTYLRLVRPGQKPGMLIVLSTFLVSAFWHGFHPGYYLFFTFAAALIVAGRSLHRNLRPFIFAPRSPFRPFFAPLYKPLGLVFTFVSLSFCLAPFVILKLEPSIQVWRSLGFIPFVWVLGVILIFDVLGVGRVLGNLGRQWGYMDVGKSKIN